MCVSMDRAAFSGTTLFAGRRRHPEHGLIEVLGYQNTAVNLAGGPNAMLLHVPARALTPENFLALRPDEADVLNLMVDALTPVPVATMDWMGAAGPGVRVFDHDVYTVLLAEDPALIPAALDRVPPHRRPRPDPELMDFYATHFPRHVVILCCFDNADARRAKPLLMWYEPDDPDRVVVPALDCHTGGAPRLDEPVRADHWVVFGADGASGEAWEPVAYPGGMRYSLREYLPDAVAGSYVSGAAPNGDFAIAYDDLLAGRLDRVERLAPS
ncbi:hypothetical protein [Actinomadura nitritigenes]|uniref:Uncharacterized protein n=1 Tax=Actinomadura nitritigenes TaxID=134602 RepID=A0ABS3QXH9_9ACTN|nr:hypothetical protein [Actinomadura nitritigenes]MBO2438702.1 hypothetical protein [Actinomadura nitritigenes]